MLQPEKLRLSPDKYREKLEGINTGYQNAKDTHEQEQSDYEAELYEIETAVSYTHLTLPTKRIV